MELLLNRRRVHACHCTESRAIWCAGGVKHPPTTSGCARRSWFTAATRSRVVMWVAGSGLCSRRPPSSCGSVGHTAVAARRRAADAAVATAAATSCRAAAGGRSGQLPAAHSRPGYYNPSLLGRMVLHYWPCYGWVRGTVALRSRAQGV